MSTDTPRVVVDPITRIEGHLRIEAETDADGAITQAYSAGTMVRGIEIILRGPRPARRLGLRAAHLRRLHAGARHRLGARGGGCAAATSMPANAQLIRNLMIARAVRARPRDALLSPARARLGRRGLGAEGRPEGHLARWRSRSASYAESSPGYFADVQKKRQELRRERPARHLRQRLLGPPGLQAAARGQPDGGGALPGGARLAARRGQAARHLRRQEPAPELRGRRRALPDQYRPDSDGGGQRPPRVNMVGLQRCRTSSSTMREFVDQVYVPDTLAIAGFYKDWVDAGRRRRQLPDLRRLPGQGHRRPVDLPDPARRDPQSRPVATSSRSTCTTPAQIQEFVEPLLVRLQRAARSGPASVRGRDRSSTTPGRSRPMSSSTSRQDYSWLKSPRWKGKAMEVGPLARVLMLYAKGHEQTKELVDMTLQQARPAGDGAVLDAGPHRRAHAGNQDHRRRHAGLVRPARSPTSRRGDVRTFNETVWEPSTWPSERAGRRASWRRRAARSATGSSSRTARSTTTRRWCPAPGTPVRAMRRASRAPTKRRCRTTTSARPEAADRDPAHHPQLRPVHRLRRARGRPSGWRTHAYPGSIAGLTKAKNLRATPAEARCQRGSGISPIRVNCSSLIFVSAYIWT